MTKETQNTKDMRKNIIYTVMVALLMSAAVTAQTQQDFQSTSTMRGTGSTLAPQVTAVGATQVGDMSTPADNVGPAKAPHIRKDLIGGTDGPQGPSPIGDAALPLMAFAVLFAGIVYVRRTKKHETN